MIKPIGVLKRITGTWGACAASAPGGGPLLRSDFTMLIFATMMCQHYGMIVYMLCEQNYNNICTFFYSIHAIIVYLIFRLGIDLICNKFYLCRNNYMCKIMQLDDLNSFESSMLANDRDSV